MLSIEELALLDDEERKSYARQKGRERDNYERILRDRILHRTNGASPENLQQELDHPTSGSGSLGIVGLVLFCIGLLLLCFAIWMFDTAPSGTHNVGLLNQQSGMTILGGALAICGSVFFAAARIVRGGS
jgi:hypothetical protein